MKNALSHHGRTVCPAAVYHDGCAGGKRNEDRTALVKLACLLLALAFSGLLFGQSDRGTITGTVTDPTGAVVPEATVTATNTGTEVPTSVKTTPAGKYDIPLLPAGTYRVAAEKAGFKSSVKDNLPVLVGQTVRMDISLEVGASVQKVEVRAQVPVLQAEGPQLQVALSNKEITDLPLAMQGASRSPIEFIRLVPGVAGAQAGFQGDHSNTGKTFATTINGGQTFSNEIQVEGVSIQNTNVGGDLRNIMFPQEAVGEFKLETNNFAAEYGRTGGGITSFTIRSGANALHGSVFEYFRNNALDARGHFNPNVATLRQNEFGGEAGGRIRRDKTFFFAYYDGFRFKRGASNQLITVPTLKERQGDFTDFVDPSGNLIPVYDPATTRPDGAGGFTRNQISCGGVLNVICPDRLSGVATKVFGYLPTPSNTGIVNNFLANGGSGTLEDRWGVKIDHAFNDKHRISGYFGWKRFTGTDPSSVSPITSPLSTGVKTIFPERVFRLNYDWFVRPNLVQHLGLGVNRSVEFGNRDNLDKDWAAAIGLKGTQDIGGMPRFNFGGGAASFLSSGYQSLGTNGGSDSNAENGYVIVDSVTWTKGKHTIKFGADIRRNQENMTFQGGGNGQFQFSNLETSLPDSPLQGNTGNAVASFLLGQVDQGFILVNPATYGNRYSYYSFFIQDNFRATSRLTFNYGLRYEIPIPRGEAFNRMSTFSPTTPNPGAGNRPGALIYSGFGPGKIGHKRFLDADLKEVGPRLGLAYQFNNRTVFRGGYGLFYTTGGALIDNGARIQSFNGYYAQPTRTSKDNGITPAFLLDNGFPQDFVRPPSLIPDFANGSNVDWIDYPGVNRAPYVQDWNVAIQRQVGNNISLEMAYVGSKGTRLGSRLTTPNQVDPKWLSLGAELNQPISCLTGGSCPKAVAAGVQNPYPGFSASVAQALRPYPQYNSVYNDFEDIGLSTYHALQVKFEKRFSQDFNFLVAYTLSKAIDNSGSQLAAFFSAGAQDQFNRRAEKSISDNYIPQNLVFNYTYELPFGPGKRFGKHGGAVGKVIGGWEFTAIHEYQSGGPVLSGFGGNLQVNDTLPIFNQILRPNLVLGQKKLGTWSGKFDPAKDTYLNPNAFSVPAPYTFGNAARNYSDMRGFAYLNEDFSIIKRTYIDEVRNLEFRMDLFNPFNRTVFQTSSINNNLSSLASYGKVGAQGNLPREIQFALRLHF